MDAAACRVIYIDDRFDTEKWLSREAPATPISPSKSHQTDFNELPPDLRANVNAILSVFSQGMENRVLVGPVIMHRCPFPHLEYGWQLTNLPLQFLYAVLDVHSRLNCPIYMILSSLNALRSSLYSTLGRKEDLTIATDNNLVSQQLQTLHCRRLLHCADRSRFRPSQTSRTAYNYCRAYLPTFKSRKV